MFPFPAMEMPSEGLCVETFPVYTMIAVLLNICVNAHLSDMTIPSDGHGCYQLYQWSDTIVTEQPNLLVRQVCLIEVY